MRELLMRVAWVCAAVFVGAVTWGADEVPMGAAVMHEEDVAGVGVMEMEHAQTQPGNGGDRGAGVPATQGKPILMVDQDIPVKVRIQIDEKGRMIGIAMGEPATQPATQPSETQPTVSPLDAARLKRLAELRAANEGGALAHTQPATEATTQSATQPATQPTTQPTTRPWGRSATQPSTQPATQPTTRPATTQPKTLLPLAPVRPAWDHYQVIYQRNMFMAQRSGGSIFGTEGQIPRNTDNTSRPQTTPAPPRVFWVLTGVAVLDDDKMAFAENMSTGQTTRARVGDKLGDGKVTSISAEGVDLDVEGKTSKVLVGAALDGRSVEGVLSSGAPHVVQPDAPVGASGSTGGSGASGAGAASTAPGTSDEAAIRERLKRRRQEQGGN